MKIFQKLQEIWSGQECYRSLYGQTDERADEGHSFNPFSTSRNEIQLKHRGSHFPIIYIKK